MKKVILCTILAVCFLTGCQKNYIKEGTAYLEKQQYEEAQKAFEEAVDGNQDIAGAYKGLGIVYYEQKDYQKAGESFQKVLDNKGEMDPVLYNLMGVSFIHREDAKGALDAFKKGIGLAEDKEKNTSGQSYTDMVQEMKFNEIVCYEKLLDWESAKAKMEEYIKQYPDDKEAQKEAEFLSTR